MQYKILQEEIVIPEACTVGIFWNDPSQYSFYPADKLNTDTFLNTHWGFFFDLGRYMASKDVVRFDDITTARFVQELNLAEQFERYGGFDTVREVMYEVRDKSDNLDAYYADIKKYNLLNSLTGLLGEKVLQPNGRYDYHRLNKEQLFTYWSDKINNLGLDGDAKYDEHFLLEGLEDAIADWDENPATGLEFFQSEKMTKICTGWDFGHVYMYGGFGGSGKTSLTFNKVIMSCIKNKEKLLVIANEQSVEEFKKILVVSAMGAAPNIKPIPRQRLNEGEFKEDEVEKMQQAIKWVRSISEGDEKLITFVFMESYHMPDVKKLIRYYANRGIRRVLIDTGKPSEGDASMARWERFTEDMKEVYKLARPNGGGLNLAVWVNVQLADAALSHRFLNEHALGDSKKIKNEVSVLFMGRTVWDDEFPDGKNPLKVQKYRYDPNNPLSTKGYIAESVKLERGKTYYLLFTAKNRRGQDNKTGQPVLVFEVNFNSNIWKEIGQTNVYDDRSY